MRLNDLSLGILSLALGLTVIGFATTFPAVPGQDYGPGLFPALIGAGMSIAGLSLVAANFRSQEHLPLFALLDWQRSRRPVTNAILLIAAVVFYTIAVEQLGFILTCSFVLMVTLVRFYGHPLLSLVISAASALAFQYIFADLLLVPLSGGLLQSFFR